MKNSTVHKTNHDVADFKDRTRHTNKAETKVSNSLEEGLRKLPEAQEGVQLHDKFEAIRERNANAYRIKDYASMTYAFLEKVYNYPESVEVGRAAGKELDRRDAIQQSRTEKYAKAEQKKELIRVRNHEALISSPKKFHAMTYGLLTNIAKNDPEFMKRLDQNGYKFDSYDFVEAGFEVQRRLQDKEKKIADMGAQLSALEVDPIANKEAIEKVLYLLEKLTGGKTNEQEADGNW